MGKVHFPLLLICPFLFSWLLLGCGQPGREPPVIRIGYATHDHHSPLYIAAQSPEYFMKNGGIFLKEISYKKEYDLIIKDRVAAKVLVSSSVGGEELIRKLTEEQFDLSFGGVPAMLTFIDKGSPIRILSPVMAEGAGLVVRNDLPVNDWRQFLEYVRASKNPVRIGYKIAVSVQNLIFEQALKASSISYTTELDDKNAQIVLVNLHGTENLIPAMENRLIDGFVVMQPYLALAEEKKAGKVVALLNDLPPAGKWQGYPCCALAGNNHFIKKYPEAVEAIITLFMRASRYIEEYPEKSASQVGRWLDLPTPVEKKSLPTIKFTIDFDESWNHGVDFWVSSMIEAGKINDHVKKAHLGGTLAELVYDRALFERGRKNLSP